MTTPERTPSIMQVLQSRSPKEGEKVISRATQFPFRWLGLGKRTYEDFFETSYNLDDIRARHVKLCDESRLFRWGRFFRPRLYEVLYILRNEYGIR